MERIKRFLKEEEGVTMIEYGLLAALIAVALIATVKLVQTGLTNTFTAVSTNLTAAS
jgi:pilus assembly protein Flp/PilA